MSVLQDENIRKILKPIGIVFSLFQILIVLQPMEAMSLRSIHLGFVMVMVFLLHGILNQHHPSNGWFALGLEGHGTGWSKDR